MAGAAVGALVGTVQAKADGWLDRDTLVKEVGRIRDAAVDLLDHVRRGRQTGREAAADAGRGAAGACEPWAGGRARGSVTGSPRGRSESSTSGWAKRSENRWVRRA